MEIRKFEITDRDELFLLMKMENEDWSDYYNHQEKYLKAISNSITYVLLEQEKIVGYIRCKNDDGYGIYILDLLVDKNYRGKEYGKSLMKTVCDNYPNDEIYVTSDVDPYYEKQGCEKVGTVFEVNFSK